MARLSIVFRRVCYHYRGMGVPPKKFFTVAYLCQLLLAAVIQDLETKRMNFWRFWLRLEVRNSPVA